MNLEQLPGEVGEHQHKTNKERFLHCSGLIMCDNEGDEAEEDTD